MLRNLPLSFCFAVKPCIDNRLSIFNGRLIGKIKPMADHSHKHSNRRKLHQDWRVWLALLLMLAAILMYVLSLDDSIIPR